MGAKNRRDIEEYSGVILHCSHLEPLDLQGVHPNSKAERVKMEDMKKNYASMDVIAEEFKNVGIEDFLDFYANDDFEFAKCEGCDEPLLGHLEVKCTVKEEVK